MNYPDGMTASDLRHVEGPEVHEYQAAVRVTFWLELDGLEFDVGSQDQQMQEWMRDEFMPRAKMLLSREFMPGHASREIDGEFEVEEVIA